jgi:hypothetical protein
MISIRSLLPLVALLLTASACGPATPAADAPAGHAEHDEHAEHEKHHAEMAGPAHDFHEALAPLWHADKWPDRVAKTCAQVTVLRDKAAAIEAGKVPEHADEAGWKADAGALTGAIKALAAECEKEGRPEFEARFAAVHDGFHKLAERVEH